MLVTAVVVLFVLVVAVLVVDAIGYALYSRQPATSESFLVRSPIRYAWLGAVGLVVSASMLLTDHSFWAMDYFIMALLAVSLVLSALSLPGLWELRVEGDELAQRGLLGGTRSVSKRDISHVELSRRHAIYHIYQRGEKKPVISVNGRCVGILAFSAWLERSGIKVTAI